MSDDGHDDTAATTVTTANTANIAKFPEYLLDKGARVLDYLAAAANASGELDKPKFLRFEAAFKNLVRGSGITDRHTFSSTSADNDDAEELTHCHFLAVLPPIPGLASITTSTAFFTWAHTTLGHNVNSTQFTEALLALTEQLTSTTSPLKRVSAALEAVAEMDRAYDGKGTTVAAPILAEILRDIAANEPVFTALCLEFFEAVTASTRTDSPETTSLVKPGDPELLRRVTVLSGITAGTVSANSVKADAASTALAKENAELREQLSAMASGGGRRKKPTARRAHSITTTVNGQDRCTYCGTVESVDRECRRQQSDITNDLVRDNVLQEGKHADGRTFKLEEHVGLKNAYLASRGGGGTASTTANSVSATPPSFPQLVRTARLDSATEAHCTPSTSGLVRNRSFNLTGATGHAITTHHTTDRVLELIGEPGEPGLICNVVDAISHPDVPELICLTKLVQDNDLVCVLRATGSGAKCTLHAGDAPLVLPPTLVTVPLIKNVPVVRFRDAPAPPPTLASAARVAVSDRGLEPGFESALLATETRLNETLLSIETQPGVLSYDTTPESHRRRKSASPVSDLPNIFRENSQFQFETKNRVFQKFH